MVEEVIRKVKGLLEASIGQCEAFLDAESNGHVTGHVVAGEFDGLSYEERRKRIRAVIDEAVASGKLSEDDALKVSTLLTYTPNEWSVTLPDD